MASIRVAARWMPDAASCAAASPGSLAAPPPGPPAARVRLRSCCGASLASDNSSEMTSAARRISRASPICPRFLANSPILVSTYCARRRMRGSCPSAQLRAKSRPLTLTTTWPMSVLPFEQLRELGKRGVDPPGERRGYACRPLVFVGRALCRIRRRFEPRNGRFKPGNRAVEFAHAGSLGTAGPDRQRARDLMHPLVFLQRADVVRTRRLREELRPLRPRHLADIEVAARVDGESVRPEKGGRRRPGMQIAEPRQELALIIDDADPRPEIGAVAVDRLHRTKFADIADRPVRIRHEDPARPVQIVPLRLVLAVAVEYLDPVVFAVGDVDPTIGVGADVVDDVELAGVGAGLAPRHQQLAVGRIFVHAGIAVAVRHIELAVRR